MGTIQHDAIIVTCCDLDMLIKAKAYAQDLFYNKEYANDYYSNTIVSNIVGTGMNGYYSFLISPDGSKLGWGMSQDFRDKRTEFLSYLETFNLEDGSSWFDFVRIEYGEVGVHITDSNCS